MIRQIKETSLYVKDLNRTRQFYEDKLGLKLITLVENRHVFFRAGDSILLCFLPESTIKNGGLPTHSASGSIHIAFEITVEIIFYVRTK
jgi:catechol 2,3-dioxygenase-like lactoylglutathione lyase family enzyme